MRITKNFKLKHATVMTSTLMLVLISQNIRIAVGRALTNTSRFSIESNSIQRDIVETQTHNDFSRSLKRVFLSNRTVTCNDGSQSGFYLRKSQGSKKWVVFLEGGWHCFDTKSCRARWLKLRHLMTSAQWPETRDVGGILSPMPDENPYWYNANHVLVPYCSSDSWSGAKAQADTRDGWRFMGSLIIRQVIADLIPLGLGRTSGSELLLVGSSAGALGVMINLDRINSFLHNEKNLKVLVRGVSDSGWFLDREPYTPGAVAASEGVRQGWKMWEGSLPEACVKQHKSEPWRCYYGYRLYPTLKSPLFVFQWLFDEAQMRADNVGAPVTPQQWNYIHDMGGALRQSLDNVTAVFAPSCIGHAVLSKRDWLNIKIDDISLPEALRCWEQTTRRKHNKLRRGASSEQPKRNDKRRRHNQKHRHSDHENHQDLNGSSRSNNGAGSVGGGASVGGAGNDGNTGHKKLTKEEREQRRRHNERRRNHRRLLRTTQISNDDKSFAKNRNKNNGPGAGNGNGQLTNTNKNKRKNLLNLNENQNQNNNGRNGNGNGNKKKRRRNQFRQHQYQREQEDQPFNKHRRNHGGNGQQLHNQHGDTNTKIIEPKKCSLRLLERCSWPQCNHSCPILTNPLTGEEMRFLELLASFGLDIEAVAAALGVDMQTLNNMDQTELVNLLTQQVS